MSPDCWSLIFLLVLSFLSLSLCTDFEFFVVPLLNCLELGVDALGVWTMYIRLFALATAMTCLLMFEMTLCIANFVLQALGPRPLLHITNSIQPTHSIPDSPRLSKQETFCQGNLLRKPLPCQLREAVSISAIESGECGEGSQTIEGRRERFKRKHGFNIA
jgi:hypothetical protein